MKKSIAILFAGMFVLGISSCSKETECTYYDNTGILKTATTKGKNQAEDLETDLNDQWGIYGDVTCVEK
jgi:hypothetical protein